MGRNNKSWNSETLWIIDIITAVKEVKFCICFGDAPDYHLDQEMFLKILYHCKMGETSCLAGLCSTIASLVVPGLLPSQDFLEMKAGRYEENSAQHHLTAGKLLWGFRGTSYF